MQIMGKYKKWIGYVAYGVLLALALLYYRFPSDAVRDYLQGSAGSVDPGLVLSIGKVAPSYDLGMRLMGVEISHQEVAKGSIFKAESLVIRPGIWSLVRGRLKLLFKGIAYSGAIKGSAQFAEGKTRQALTLSLELEKMRLDDHETLQGLVGRRVKGDLSGVISYAGRLEALMEGEGEANLTLINGQVEPQQPLLNLIKSIDFRDMGIKMALRNRRVDLSRVEWKGQSMQGTVSGVVILNKSLPRSSLDLRGTVEPLGDLSRSLAEGLGEVRSLKQRLKGGKLSFVIQGSISSPSIRFM